MIDIFSVNQSLEGSLALNLNEGCLHIDNDTQLSTIDGLTTTQRCDLQTLKDQIAQTIPDDFGYVITLDGEEPSFELEFQDGYIAASGFSLEFSSNEEFQAQLQHADWDAIRGDALESIQGIEAMIAAGKKGAL
ncbi:MAG: hypothetical protein AAFX93_19280 [Verrucomicrobiota bacterium]